MAVGVGQAPPWQQLHSHLGDDAWIGGIQVSLGYSPSTCLKALLTLILLGANLAIQNDAQNLKKMAETLVYGYSSESTQQELSNEYQHDRV